MWNNLSTLRLAFADHVHGLIAGNCAPSAPKRSEMLTRVDPSLDRAVVLFQDVIKVLHRSMSTVLFQNTVGFELNDICFDIFLGLLILLAVAFCPPATAREQNGWQVDSLRADPSASKPLGRRCIALGRKKEVDGRPSGIHGTKTSNQAIISTVSATNTTSSQSRCANAERGKGRIYTDSLLSLENPSYCKMLEFRRIPELHFLFNPGPLRTNRHHAELKRFGYFTCRTATPA